MIKFPGKTEEVTNRNNNYCSLDICWKAFSHAFIGCLYLTQWLSDSPLSLTAPIAIHRQALWALPNRTPQTWSLLILCTAYTQPSHSQPPLAIASGGIAGPQFWPRVPSHCPFISPQPKWALQTGNIYVSVILSLWKDVQSQQATKHFQIKITHCTA